jgi:predicted nuclease of restriction endonuclease-like RecB superfamily
MLRSEHAILIFDGGKALPDRLSRSRHVHYLDYAQKMLSVYEGGAGKIRLDLHRSIQNIFASEPDCDRRRIAGFCKLLDDRAKFEKDGRGNAAALRLRVFTLAAKYHPLVVEQRLVFEHAEHEVKNLIAAEVGQPWPQIATALYRDIIEFQPLKTFESYPDPQSFLSRYNVAQLQACLYRAEALSITASADFKTILRYAKLARLLHVIRRVGAESYRIDLSGPASVLQQTRRYGVNFARFVPALLACEDWKLRATIRTPWSTAATLWLSHDDGLTSHLPPPKAFDSSIEESFATAFGSEREGWKLFREGAILHHGQATFVPDFVFRHADGREAHLEIVGFWTPEYLQSKRQTLNLFRNRRILLAVAEQLMRKKDVVPEGVIVYRKAIDPQDVVRLLNSVQPLAASHRDQPT